MGKVARLRLWSKILAGGCWLAAEATVTADSESAESERERGPPRLWNPFTGRLAARDGATSEPP